MGAEEHGGRGNGGHGQASSRRFRSSSALLRS
jgi:hypothetical protein